MNETTWAIIHGALFVTGIVVVGKILTALVDIWAAWSIGRICDDFELPPERRKTLLLKCRDRKVGRPAPPSEGRENTP